MKVLHIIKDLEPGGIQTLLLDIANNRHGFNGEIALLVIGEGRLEKAFVNSGIRLFKLQRNKLIDFKAIGQFRKILKDFKPEIIHTHHALEVLYVFLGSWGLKIKKIHSHHTHP
ncbi:MAG: glycosyltransferase, partial [Bacteroidetes bacterium]|nr:glycosyltransferase [Bacteroidota bacterium]